MRLCFSIILQHQMMWMSLMCCVEFKYSKIHSFIICITLFLLSFSLSFFTENWKISHFYKIKSSYTPLFLSVQSLSCVPLFGTPWTVACQAPLFMGFSRQEYWNGLPFPSPLIVLEYYFFSSDRAVILTFQISQVVPSWLLLNSLTVIISNSRFILYPPLNYSINERIILLYICIYI